MSTLSDFVYELADELDRRRVDGRSPLPAFPPDQWTDFCKLLYVIDRDETPNGIELRRRMEEVVTQRDLSLGQRCRELLSLLLPLLPIGSVQ